MQESAAPSNGVTRALTSVLLDPALAAPALAEPPLAGAPDWAGVCHDPVFVLCCGRSGSTLLRFLLDAHPDLACPPEMKLPEVFARLTGLWSTIEAFPLSDGSGKVTAGIPAAAVAGIRHTMDLVVGPYLARRGKKRFCDKNLGTEYYADLLLSVYPE